MSIRSTIAAGRRLMGTTLLDEVEIADHRPTRTATGGQKDAWVPRGVTVKARFDRLDDKDARPIAGLTYGAAAANLHLPRGTEISEGDRVKHAATGRLWTVVARQSPPGEFELSTEVLVREVGG